MASIWWLSFRGVGAMIVPSDMASEWDNAIDIAITHGAPDNVEVAGGLCDMDDPRNVGMPEEERRYNSDPKNHLRILTPDELRQVCTLADGDVVDAAIEATRGVTNIGVDFGGGGFVVVDEEIDTQ